MSNRLAAGALVIGGLLILLVSLLADVLGQLSVAARRSRPCERPGPHGGCATARVDAWMTARATFRSWATWSGTFAIWR
jgi:hypothetical protein